MKDVYIKNKKDLLEFLEYERKLYNIKKKRPPIFCLKENEILWKYNYVLRKAEYYTNTSKKLRGIFLKLRLKRLQNKYFLNIPINTFDKGLKLIHLGPRLVNGKARIGKNCVMHINTCIVAGGRDNGVPTLGDNIVMGVASVVAGNVYIADNIAIGANAFVNKTFSQGDITIAGVPAKKISDYSRKDWNK